MSRFGRALGQYGPLFQASPEERADVDVAARLRNVVV
jgi:hypothetical protein